MPLSLGRLGLLVRSLVLIYVTFNSHAVPVRQANLVICNDIASGLQASAVVEQEKEESRMERQLPHGPEHLQQEPEQVRFHC